LKLNPPIGGCAYIPVGIVMGARLGFARGNWSPTPWSSWHFSTSLAIVAYHFPEKIEWVLDSGPMAGWPLCGWPLRSWRSSTKTFGPTRTHRQVVAHGVELTAALRFSREDEAGRRDAAFSPPGYWAPWPVVQTPFGGQSEFLRLAGGGQFTPVVAQF